MKSLTFGFLCFALISVRNSFQDLVQFFKFYSTQVASCQYLISSTVIKERSKILATNCKWFLSVDASFYDVYEALKSTVTKTYASFGSGRNNLLNAFDNLHDSLQYVNATGVTVDSTPESLSSFVRNLNSTLEFYATYAVQASVGVFGMSGMMGDLAQPARDLQMNLQSSLSNILMHITMPNPTAPISDACAAKILSKFSSLYQPYVNKILESKAKVIKVLPEVRTNITAFIQNAQIELKSLTQKINACNQIKSFEGKLNCAENLVSKISRIIVQVFINFFFTRTNSTTETILL